jgi:2-keto-4-pentenoate hydratase
VDSAAAAPLLLKHWQEGTRLAGLPPGLQPHSRQGAYDIAGQLGALKGSPVRGWKIAATSEAGQRHINVSGPLGGRIYADRLLGAGAIVPLGTNVMRVAEAEFAFTLGRDLPRRAAPYGREDVLDAVDGLCLSIEIPDSRYEDFTAVGADQLIADTACACWLVLSAPVAADWRGLDLAEHVVTGWRNGARVSSGFGKAALGDPILALQWMANEAASHCGGLRAGQFVTTGTCLKPFAIAPGDRIAADYGVLGRLDAAIA